MLCLDAASPLWFMKLQSFYILHLQVLSDKSFKPWVSEIVSTCISVLLFLQHLSVDS